METEMEMEQAPRLMIRHFFAPGCAHPMREAGPKWSKARQAGSCEPGTSLAKARQVLGKKLRSFVSVPNLGLDHQLTFCTRRGDTRDFSSI